MSATERCIGPSTITTEITEPPRVGSKATAVTPEPQVVVAADWAAASGLTYAEKFETGEQCSDAASLISCSVSFFPCFSSDTMYSCKLNKYAARGAKPAQDGGFKDEGIVLVVFILAVACKLLPGPGVTSHTTTVDGFTRGTPATCIVPASVIIASAAIMPLGPAPNRTLLIENHFEGDPL